MWCDTYTKCFVTTKMVHAYWRQCIKATVLAIYIAMLAIANSKGLNYITFITLLNAWNYILCTYKFAAIRKLRCVISTCAMQLTLHSARSVLAWAIMLELIVLWAEIYIVMQDQPLIATHVRKHYSVKHFPSK